MQPLRFVTLSALFGMLLLLPADAPVQGADDAPELGPGVASHVAEQDAPLDHAETLQAVKDGVRMSGAGDPLKNTEPLKNDWFQSGKDPYDAFYFKAGPDGKIYGKGQKAPKGSRNLRIKVQRYRGAWVSYAELYHREGDDMITDGLAGSGVHESDQLESEKNSESGREARGQKYEARDPRTAVLQAIFRMQRKRALYDPLQDMPQDSAPAPESPAPENPKKEDLPKTPERQAHPVHGSRQAHPVHGAPVQAASFGDEFKSTGTGNGAMGRDMAFDDAEPVAPDHDRP